MKIVEAGRIYRSKKELICCKLKEDIRKGVVPIGSGITVSSIAQMYNVSEIPVREAVQKLIQEGYLEVKPQAGLSVKPISAEDVREIFELRMVLEPLAATLAVKHIGPEEIKVLRGIIEDSFAYIQTKDYVGYLKHNHGFHNYIYSFANNTRLAGMMKEVLSYSTRYPQYYTNTAQIEKSIAEHTRMVDAMEAGEEEITRCLFVVHTKDSFDNVLRRLEEAAGKT